MTEKQSIWSIETFSLDNWRKTRDSSVLLSLCHGVGLFYVVDHNIPDYFFSRHFSVLKEFFLLPESVKALIEKRNSPHFRGWEKIGSELTNNKVDFREQVDLSEEYDPYPVDITPHYLRLDGPNQWIPEELLPGFKDICKDFFRTLGSVAWEILEALAVGLELPPDYFRIYFGQRPLSFVKLISYPPTPDGEAGVNPHKDSGFLSLLIQDGAEASGLQALAPDGIWLDVSPPKAAIVVNVGEILQAMTGNYCIACVHRVIAKNSRFSSAYFHGPDLRTVIAPVDVPQRFREAVAASPRHAGAKYMTKRQELLDGEDDISGACALSYGEQLWSYLARSYPENVRHHYPQHSDLK